MSQIVVIQNETRRELCEDCAHCAFAMVQLSPDQLKNPPEDAVNGYLELPTCRLKYHRTCDLRRALSDPSATCPNEDKELSARWNAAACETLRPCADKPNQVRNRVKEDFEGVTIFRDASQRLPNAPAIAPRRGTPAPTFQVAPDQGRFYYD